MPPKPHIPKVCLQCGQDYLAKVSQQLTCSLSCRAKLQHSHLDEERRAVIVAALTEARRITASKQRQAEARGRMTVEQARAARLAREKAQGRRTFTIDPWEQRPGAADIDGSNGL